jgi:prepilin-type N-terminal cleavage/methylation domain-containing protein
MNRNGFTLFEVMISLAIVGGLLMTLIYTLNYHLGIAERQVTVTTLTNLAKEKIYEMEKNLQVSRGNFPEPNVDVSYETFIEDSAFPGMKEIRVVVKKEKESMGLSELMRKGQ